MKGWLQYFHIIKNDRLISFGCEETADLFSSVESWVQSNDRCVFVFLGRCWFRKGFHAQTFPGVEQRREKSVVLVQNDCLQCCRLLCQLSPAHCSALCSRAGRCRLVVTNPYQIKSEFCLQIIKIGPKQISFDQNTQFYTQFKNSIRMTRSS